MILQHLVNSYTFRAMKIRKSVCELTPEDIKRIPVWEFALDEEGEPGQDETTVRPYEYTGELNPSDGMFVVLASFILADGTKWIGYLTPSGQHEDNLGRLQPIIVTDAGQVMFWCGSIAPSADELARRYGLLGRDANKVFQVRFESQVPLVGGAINGTISGFFVLDDWKNAKVKIIT
jgi:hypothetical protein